MIKLSLEEKKEVMELYDHDDYVFSVIKYFKKKNPKEVERVLTEQLNQFDISLDIWNNRSEEIDDDDKSIILLDTLNTLLDLANFDREKDYWDDNLKAEQFEFGGMLFEPIGNISGNFVNKCQYTTWSYSLKPNNYTHKDFYKVAKKHHASCDIFLCNGKLYIPCDSSLLGICKNPQIKRVEEYKRWYH